MQKLPLTRQKYSSKEKLKARIHERRLEKERQQRELDVQVARTFVPVKPRYAHFCYYIIFTLKLAFVFVETNLISHIKVINILSGHLVIRPERLLKF